MVGEKITGLNDEIEALRQEGCNPIENDEQTLEAIEILTSPVTTDRSSLSSGTNICDNGAEGNDGEKITRTTTVRFESGAQRESGGSEGNGETRLSANIMHRLYSPNRTQAALTRVKPRLATLMVLPDKGREKGRILRTRVTADALPHARNRHPVPPLHPAAAAVCPRGNGEGRKDGYSHSEESKKRNNGIGGYPNLEANDRTMVEDGRNIVKRSESEKYERRGRSLFRGIGAHFSTSAARRVARSPVIREHKSIISRIRWCRTVSQSPPPHNRRCGRRKGNRFKDCSLANLSVITGVDGTTS